ncbi:hypothetical protein NDU88_001062 [Pleurodeles waltl]|uniref:Uncharacterized protein n=1 Tax=Pleurodeles waltl TaxID=8319 RepID=A0AAV7S6B3_PLEWA|nr:hypothetical protein NDU88_001062 [Pleurodeles waltl]
MEGPPGARSEEETVMDTVSRYLANRNWQNRGNRTMSFMPGVTQGWQLSVTTARCSDRRYLALSTQLPFPSLPSPSEFTALHPSECVDMYSVKSSGQQQQALLGNAI